MYLKLIYIFFILIFYTSSSYGSISNDQESILTDQFISYIDEYEQNKSTSSAWLIYLVLNEQNNSDFLLNDILRNDSIISSYHTFSTVIDCVNNNDFNTYFSDSYLHSLVLCLNDNSLIIAHLYENINDSSIIHYFGNYLQNSSLTHKERYHLNYISDKSINEDYKFDNDSFNILDFYYFDHLYTDENDHSLDTWVRNLNAANAITDSERKSLFLATINGLYKTGNEFEVFELSKKIINFYDLPISKYSLRIFSYISYSSYVNGFYQYDIDINRNIIIPLTSYFSLETKMRAHIDFGVSLYRIGNVTSSLAQLEFVYNSFDDFSDFRYHSALLNNLGIAYLNTGLFEKYIQLQLEALKFAEINEDLSYQIYFLNNLYVYHRKIENWTSATEYLKLIQEKAQLLNDNNRLSRAELAFGIYQRDYHDDFELALNHLDKSIDIAFNIDDYRLITTVMGEIAKTYEKLKEYDIALKYHNDIVNHAKQINDDITILYNYIKIANLYIKMDKYDESLYYINILEKADRSKMIFRDQVERETVISKSHIYNNETDEALKILRDFAKETIHRLRHSTDMQSGHILLESEYISLFKTLIELLVSESNWNEAFYWMDEIKNLSTAFFYNNTALKSSILSESELILDFALRNRIDRLRTELLNAASSQRVQLNNQLLEAISEQNVLRRKVLQNIDLEAADLKKLQNQLGSSDVVLYFSKFDDYLFAATITSGSLNIQRMEFIDEDQQRIEKLVEDLSSDRISLYELEWIRSRILDKMDIDKKYTNYIVIPDGFLYQIPIEILPVGKVTSNYSYGDTKYLIENASVSYANSLKDLEMSMSHTSKRKYKLDFLGIGIAEFENPESQILPGRILPPLPLAGKEVIDIASILTNLKNNEYLLSQNGTEQAFRRNAGDSRILHLASHSEVFANDPLYSLIYLNSGNNPEITADGSKDDGLIYAYELFDMDLSNEMIMLNSCESGSGNYIQGSGIVGFSRAFNYAGVQSLILNLWSIRDRAAYEMSVSFYKYLNEGSGKHDAMRKAKIDYLNNTNSNPSNWGSFVVYGNVDPIMRSHNPWIIGLIVLLFGIVSIAAAWWRFYRTPFSHI